jgi:glucokinase
MKEYCFGVDLGGTTVKIGLFKTDGSLVKSFEIPTRKEDCGEKILPDIAAALNNSLTENHIDKAQVSGIGIGVPGPVLDDGTVNGCVNLGWGTKNVVFELYQLTGFKVAAGNDATVAALGEIWQGGGKGCENLVMITLGTGVGGGIIINGRPVNGSHGAGGEIGHIPVVMDETQVCSCGKKGCLEQVASATGIVKEAKKLLAGSDKPSALRNIDNLTAKDIFDEAKKGDEIAITAVELLGKYLGIAMADVAGVVDPQVFVIGGGVSKAGQFLVDAIEKNYKKYAFYACRNADIRLAVLGNDAGMYGAARLVIE